jgi:hypothetical protein
MTNPYAYFWFTGEVTLPEPHLIAWLKAQRLLPLVGWRAEGEGWKLPPEVLRAVRQDHYRLTAEQSLVSAQLEQLAELAKRAAIPVVVVKGPVVAQRYPSPYLRPYGDLDLLVPPESVNSFYARLQAAGYLPMVAGDRAFHLPPLRPALSGLRLEVHGTLDMGRKNPHFSFEKLDGGLCPWDDFPGLLVPHPCDHFAYLVYHLVARHQLEVGLLPIADVRFWTQGWGREEWHSLASRTQDGAVRRMIGLCLALTARFWPDFTLPDSAEFPEPSAELLASSQTIALGDGVGRMPHVWRDLPSFTVSGWLSYLQAVLLGDPSSRRNLPLRERLGFYLQRPFRIAKHYAPSVWRLLRGDSRSRGAWTARRDLAAWLRAGD